MHEAIDECTSAVSTDLTLFNTGTVAAPNILVLLDSSGSMGDPPSSCSTCGSKWDIARDSLTQIIQTVNPPDGSGGYIENARFGIFTFGQGTQSTRGGQLLVPITSGNTAAVLTAIPAAAAPTGVTPLGSALADMARYYSGSRGWGSFPLFGPGFDTIEPVSTT